MLIQITNRCRMGCPHCMDDSNPKGEMMTKETFLKALSFATHCDEVHLLISGGEPTEHPELLDFCKMVNNAGFHFSLCSNGMWLGDEKMEYRMKRIASLPMFVGCQIYSNPKWYRLHDETLAKYGRNALCWKRLNVFIDTTDINAMSDIGRARSNDMALEETKNSKYHCMCLTSCVSAAQTGNLKEFSRMMLVQGRFCTPLVDVNGNLHMSESWLCPSVGNVKTDTCDRLWENIKAFRPCGNCIPCKRYLTENSPKMVAVRRLLGQ